MSATPLSPLSNVPCNFCPEKAAIEISKDDEYLYLCRACIRSIKIITTLSDQADGKQ